MSPIVALEREDVHRFGLDRLEHVHAQIDQLAHNRLHIPARVQVNDLAGVADARVHALQMGLEEAPPVPRADEQVLLSPVVIAEPDGVDPISVVANQAVDYVAAHGFQAIHQRIDEGRVVVHVHHNLFHAAYRPGALPEEQAELHDLESVRVFVQPLREAGEMRIGREVREHIAIEAGLSQRRPVDMQDRALPPQCAKIVHERIFRKRLPQRKDFAHHLMVCDDRILDITHAVPVGQGACHHRVNPHVVRADVRFFEGERLQHTIPRQHCRFYVTGNVH